jgi:hypothetical protein
VPVTNFNALSKLINFFVVSNMFLPNATAPATPPINLIDLALPNPVKV